MKVRYYGPSHPMVVAQNGDPARGLWKPWERQVEIPKRRRRRRR